MQQEEISELKKEIQQIQKTENFKIESKAKMRNSIRNSVSFIQKLLFMITGQANNTSKASKSSRRFFLGEILSQLKSQENRLEQCLKSLLSQLQTKNSELEQLGEDQNVYEEKFTLLQEKRNKLRNELEMVKDINKISRNTEIDKLKAKIKQLELDNQQIPELSEDLIASEKNWKAKFDKEHSSVLKKVKKIEELEKICENQVNQLKVYQEKELALNQDFTEYKKLYNSEIIEELEKKHRKEIENLRAEHASNDNTSALESKIEKLKLKLNSSLALTKKRWDETKVLRKESKSIVSELKKKIKVLKAEHKDTIKEMLKQHKKELKNMKFECKHQIKDLEYELKVLKRNSGDGNDQELEVKITDLEKENKRMSSLVVKLEDQLENERSKQRDRDDKESFQGGSMIGENSSFFARGHKGINTFIVSDEKDQSRTDMERVLNNTFMRKVYEHADCVKQGDKSFFVDKIEPTQKSQKNAKDEMSQIQENRDESLANSEPFDEIDTSQAMEHDIDTDKSCYYTKSALKRHFVVCDLCIKKVTEDQEGMKCQDCQCGYHVRCLDKREHNKELNSEGRWVCTRCVKRKNRKKLKESE